MQRRICLALLSLMLVCGAALAGCAAGAEEAAVMPTPAPSDPPGETALESVLESLPGDVARESPGAYAVAWACHDRCLEADASGRFRPDDPADRAGLAQALLRLSGGEAPAYDGRFPDVSAGDGCAAGAVWCARRGILDGIADGAFEPERQVTRAELAVMLYRYAQPNGYRTHALEDYPDGDAVPEYAREAMCWAVSSGVFRGLVGSYLLPDYPVSRAQLAQALVYLEAASDEAAAQCARQCASREAEGVSFREAGAIQAAIDATAEKYGAMGVQVAVVENGSLANCFSGGWATAPAGAGYGDAGGVRLFIQEADGSQTEVEYAGDLMSVDHKERCASISKVVLGMAAMALSEEGTVDLQEGIGAYWDTKVEKGVCIDNILTHTSTIIMAGDDAAYKYASVRRCISGRGGKAGDISAWGYNNFAFGVLGMTLELASGEMIDDVLNERFFDLMYIDAAFRPAHIEAQDKLVTLYRGKSVERSIDKQRRIGELSQSPGGYGGLFSGGLTISAKDLGKLTCVLAGDGRYEGLRVLSEESVAHMEESIGTTGDGFQQCRPLRSQSDMYGRERLYYHTGSAWGAYNCLSYDPATGDGVVVLTTGASSRRDDYGVYAVCGEISQTVYDLLK